MIKMFSIDLDGTLLNSEKRITDFTKKKIAEKKKKGYTIILSSGRHYSEMEYYINELHLDDSDKVICCDGIYITRYNGEIICQNDTLSICDIMYILSVVKKGNLYFYTNNKNYVLCKSFIKWIKIYLQMIIKKDKDTCLLFPRELSKYHSVSVEKVVIPTPLNIEVLKKLKKKYTIHCLKNGRTEILSIKVSKYSALKQLENMGIVEDISNVMCFGDDMNDAECFENINKCIAMGNSIPYLKKNAIFTTKTNDEDGVAYVLQQVLNNTDFVFKDGIIL